MAFGPNLAAKTFPKSSQVGSKIHQKLDQDADQFLIDLGANLGRFWEGFGSQVGAKLGPNATKTRPQNQSNKLSLFGSPPERFLVDFGSQEPFSNLPGSHSCWLLEPRWAQDAPRRPPEAPKIASKTDLGAIFVDFWLIFW